jgi:mono/diheme cytochrome c family protein
MKTCILSAAIFFVSLFGLLAAEEVSANDYAAVDAIFTKHCLDCHATQEPEAKLVLESFDTLMEGGEHGPAIVRGKSEESRLVQMLEGKIENKDGKKLIMPPGKRKKLEPAEIAAIKTWIDAGAKPPAEIKPGSFQLVTPRIIPKVQPPKSIKALTYAPASKLIALARYGEVELRSAESRGAIRTLHGHRGSVNEVVFSGDGQHLFAAAGEPGLFGEVRQWNVSDGALVRTFEGHKDALYSVALSPDGKTLATGSYDQKIKLWSTISGAEIGELAGHNGPDRVLRAVPRLLVPEECRGHRPDHEGLRSGAPAAPGGERAVHRRDAPAVRCNRAASRAGSTCASSARSRAASTSDATPSTTCSRRRRTRRARWR